MARLELIHGDRRNDRRYRFEMAVRFTYRDRTGLHTGAGTTLDLSSGGIRFVTEDPPPEGVEIELHVAWPYLLQNVCPMELLVWGQILRSNREESVVLMRRHEFRTCGARSFDTEEGGTGSCSIVA